MRKILQDKIFNVLIVDDYEINLELLEAYLGKCEIALEIFKAINGSEALEHVQAQQFDLILLDVMLPDISGFEICKLIKLKSNYQSVPIIMITALNDRESMIKGLNAGADEFLSKPVDGNELMIRVNNSLKMRSITIDLDYRYQQLQRELEIANMLQRSFLPQQLPQLEGLNFEVLYQPSSYIGGDFYEFFLIDDNKVGIFISDVKGHGVASAMITAVLKDGLYQLKNIWAEPQHLFSKLNSKLQEFFSHTSDNNDFFITAFYGVIDIGKQIFTYSNAGHSTPFALQGAELIPLKTATGIPLGIFSEGMFVQETISLTDVKELFFYTDGIFELQCFANLERKSVELSELFQNEPSKSFSQQLADLKKIITQFVEKEEITDDVNFISVLFQSV